MGTDTEILLSSIIMTSAHITLLSNKVFQEITLTSSSLISKTFTGSVDDESGSSSNAKLQ